MRMTTAMRRFGGVDVEISEGGQGRTVLFLHGGLGIEDSRPFLERLADRFRVIAPVHPGFGRSAWPQEFRGVSDLAFHYLDLTDALALDDAVLAGSCFGGWLAAELLVRSTRRFGAAVLIDPLGVKFGDRLTRDIADLHSMSEAEGRAVLFHHPRRGEIDYASLSDEALTAIARDREAFTYFGWKPYMHDAGLLRWLHRIDVPTLLVWGASDRFVTPEYGKRYADAIPGARLEVVADAGHYPHVEQPDAVLTLIARFAERGAAA